MSTTQYLSHDTIHALATPVSGALSVIRLSGPLSIKVLSSLTEGASEKKNACEVFRIKLVHHTRAGVKETLDDAVCVYFQSPRSQTGEDLVELFLHGGAIVAERVFSALSALGSRQALPGEFSFRAVRNGKMQITEAQAVADLISAKNVGAANLALEKMGGSQAKLILDLADGLRKLATMGELGIDFSDQDVEELSLPVLKKRAEKILEQLSYLAASFSRGEKIQSGVRVAFIGRPNAGKSSFFNALLGEERSIVSEIAGTTRDVIRETLNLRGVTLRIEDTAGIRASTEDRIEKIGIERSLKAAQEADLVLFIIDAGEAPSAWAETLSVWSGVNEPREKTLAILTKVDLVTPEQILKSKEEIRKLGILNIYEVSSTELRGVSEAVSGIVEFCERFTARKPGEVLLTRMDHLHAVEKTITHLERALQTPAEDLFAADLRQSLNALGPVIGETLPDDILGRIFSEFCIGK